MSHIERIQPSLKKFPQKTSAGGVIYAGAAETDGDRLTKVELKRLQNGSNPSGADTHRIN